MRSPSFLRDYFTQRVILITCGLQLAPAVLNRLPSEGRNVGSKVRMASRPGPSPLSDQQIQSVVSKLVQFYVRNRKFISRAGWLIFLVTLGNRVRVAVNDQKKPRPAIDQNASKKRKAGVFPRRSCIY